jgi:tetraacyldisaccharide 4'-kinase
MRLRRWAGLGGTGLAPIIWRGTSRSARLARWLLWPPSALYGIAVASRRTAYRVGVLGTRRLDLPVIAVGGLSVGGAGKTPLASWIAGFFADRGVTPGIVLRGTGGDEALVHRRRVPGAVVVEDHDRLRGGKHAISAGARVIVLDDAYQRLDIARDLNIAVITAESLDAGGLLPRGPWREPLTALDRADLVVITRKTASPPAARAAARHVRSFCPSSRIAIASLQISGFGRLSRNGRCGTALLAGARVLASAGIADPEAFAEQCRRLGASVTLVSWPDHYAFSRTDAARLASAGSAFDYVVITDKDGVKLHALWPARAPDPLVAELELAWEDGDSLVRDLLSHLTAVFYASHATTRI